MENKEITMQSQWHVFHTRKRTPFYVDLYTPEIAYSRRNIFNFQYHAKLYHINGRVAMREDEWGLRQKQLIARFKKDPRFLIKVMSEHYQEHQRLLSLAQIISHTSFRRLSNSACAKLLHHYAMSVRTFWTPGLIPMYGEAYLTNVVQEFVTSHLPPEKTQEVIQIFMTPKKEGVVGEEYRSLLHVAMLSHVKQEVALKQHWWKFAWMANQLFTHTFYSISYYRRMVNNLQRKNPHALLQKYERQRSAHLKVYAQWMHKLKLDPHMQLAIESLNEAIFYRSWRGEKPYESEWIVKDLIEEIAKRLGIGAQDLLFLTITEIIDLLKDQSKQWKQIILERKRGFIYLPVRGGKILTGRAVKEWEKKIEEVSNGVQELKGMTAFPGVVQGRARIVHGALALSKVKQGDILITGSTTPLYVPILGKVRAIVTEEGGVLSHASVISREMKIPCVIGTKIATKVFKDGDRVEVDAVKGIVRKI